MGEWNEKVLAGKGNPSFLGWLVLDLREVDWLATKRLNPVLNSLSHRTIQRAWPRLYSLALSLELALSRVLVRETSACWGCQRSKIQYAPNF